MSIPGFTADRSIYESRGTYRSTRRWARGAGAGFAPAFGPGDHAPGKGGCLADCRDSGKGTQYCQAKCSGNCVGACRALGRPAAECQEACKVGPIESGGKRKCTSEEKFLEASCYALCEATPAGWVGACGHCEMRDCD